MLARGSLALRPDGRRRVLVADDHDLIRRLLRHALAGHPDLRQVAEAADGEQAVLLATALRPDALVVDLGLPRLDGFDVIRRVRDALPECTIVVFSGSDGPQERERALEAGADAHVAKHDGFQALVMEVADRARARVG